MNVIFLDFDGVLHGIHDYRVGESEKDLVFKRILTLADIVKEFNCKVVIEASAKTAIDEETLEVDSECTWLQEYFDKFEELGIEVIGRTPSVIKKTSPSSFIPMWKEHEIRLYLMRHPEIEHFCIIDDNDYCDLEKVKDYLVNPLYYAESNNPLDEGLLPKHKEEVGKVLKKDNRFKKYALKHIGKKQT